MAWQDELRALDEALAQGRISADQHRSERDHILASAGSVPPLGAPQPVTPQPSTPQPGAPQQWQAANPGQQAKAGDADRTQVVPNGDPEKTAYVQVPRGGFPPNQPNQQPQPNRPGPPHQHPNQPFGAPPQATPWGQDPQFGGGDANWGYAKQGPEVFDDSSSGGGKKWLLVGLVVVLLLGGGAVWFFGFNGDGGGDPGTGATSTAASEPKAEPVTLDRLPDPPGQATEANTGEFTPDDAKIKKILGAGDHKVVVAAGTTEFAHKASVDNGVGYAVSAFPVEDGDAATKLGDALVGQHTAVGMAAFEAKGAPDGVSAMKSTIKDTNQHLLRAVYVTGDTVVRVGVLASNKLTEAQATEAFEKYLQQVLGAVPAK